MTDGWAVTTTTGEDGWNMKSPKPPAEPSFPRPAPGPQSAEFEISQEDWAKYEAEMNAQGDQCITCGEKSGYGLMKICAHCEMNACDQCGSYVYGPDVNFIRKTEEEKWDKNFNGALVVLVNANCVWPFGVATNTFVCGRCAQNLDLPKAG